MVELHWDSVQCGKTHHSNVDTGSKASLESYSSLGSETRKRDDSPLGYPKTVYHNLLITDSMLSNQK